MEERLESHRGFLSPALCTLHHVATTLFKGCNLLNLIPKGWGQEARPQGTQTSIPKTALPIYRLELHQTHQ